MTTQTIANPPRAADWARIAADAQHVEDFVNDPVSENLITPGGLVRPNLTKVVQDIRSVYGAITLRGAWVTATAYNPLDIYTSSGVAYIVLVAHTSTSVSADLAAGKVSVYRGISETDLADPSSGKGADYIANANRSFADIASLRAFPKPSLAAGRTLVVTVQEYASGSGKGGGTFRWQGTSNQTDNSGTVVNPTGNAGAGRWLRIFGGVVNAAWFGDTADGTTDDAAAIQAAHDYIVGTGKMGTLELSGGSHKCGSGLTINRSFVNLVCQGLLDFSALGSGVAITYTGTTLVSGLQYYLASCDGMQMLGPGKSSGVVAVKFQASSGQACSNVILRDFGISEFQTGLEVGSNAYVLGFVGGNVQRCTIGLNVPSGTSNSGENIRPEGVTFSACEQDIVVSNGNADVYAKNCSLDYPSAGSGISSPRFVSVVNGQLTLDECHCEGNNAGSPMGAVAPFSKGSADGAFLVLKGGSISFNIDMSSTCPYIFENLQATGRSPIDLDLTVLQNCGTSTGLLCNGDINANPRLNYGAGNFHAALNSANSNSLFADGGCEGSSVVDWYISSDSAAITSRTAGTNLSLAISSAQAHTNAKSLKLSKVGGSGSNASIQAALPIKKRAFGSSSLWYNMPGTVTGNLFVNWFYAVGYFNQYGSFVALKVQATGPTRTIAFSGSATGWLQTNSGVALDRAPAWATHYLVNISAVSLSAGDVYFDDMLATEYG